MAKALFNTLEATEILADAGIEDRKAQAMVKMTHEAVSHSVATKGDLDKLAGRVDRVESELAGRIDRVESELAGRIDRVESELGRRIDRVESLVKEESSKTHAKISETHAKISETDAKISETDAKISKIHVEIAKLGQALERRVSGIHVWFVSMILMVASALFGGVVALLVMGN